MTFIVGSYQTVDPMAMKLRWLFPIAALLDSATILSAWLPGVPVSTVVMLARAASIVQRIIQNLFSPFVYLADCPADVTVPQHLLRYIVTWWKAWSVLDGFSVSLPR